MRPSGFHHAAVLVSDLERVTAFYRDVLGLPEQQRHLHPDGRLRSVWVALGDGFLAIEQATEPVGPKPDGGRGWHVLALRIAPEERQPFRERLARASVAVERETGWTMFVRDPENNLVALSHHPFDPVT